MSDVLSAAISIGFHGLAFAMVLYLVSVGLSVTMGLMGFVNLAHGVFAAAGGYVATSLMSRLGVPFAPAILGGTIAAMLFSIPLERVLYRRFYGGDELDQVLLTIGLAFMSVAAAKYLWGPLAQPFHPPPALSGQIELGFREFPTYRSFLIASGAVLVTVLWLGLERTQFGAQIRAAVKGVFADYILALEQTGARPFSEVCKVTAADVDLENGTWTLAKWKNSKKQKGKNRVIYLTEPMMDLTRRLMSKHAEGPLFRNNTNTPWSRQSITWRFRTLGEKLKIEGLTAYAVRHGFITDAMARGVPVAVVAELCGTSIQTIQKAYNHLNVKHDVLREAARKAVG